jgi:hypothetical protein
VIPLSKGPFNQHRATMNAIQKGDDRVHDALIDCAKCRAGTVTFRPPMIACPEGFERRPVQSVEEVFARSTEQLFDDEFSTALEYDVQSGMHCECELNAQTSPEDW